MNHKHKFKLQLTADDVLRRFYWKALEILNKSNAHNEKINWWIEWKIKNEFDSHFATNIHLVGVVNNKSYYSSIIKGEVKEINDFIVKNYKSKNH